MHKGLYTIRIIFMLMAVYAFCMFQGFHILFPVWVSLWFCNVIRLGMCYPGDVYGFVL